MKKLLPLLILLTSLHLTALGQHTFGLKISGGVSTISNTQNFKHNSYSNWDSQLSPSVQGGLFYNFDINDKHMFGTELLFRKIKGKEKATAELTDFDGVTGIYPAIFYKDISYLSLPVFYGLKLNRWVLNAGMQVSYALSSSQKASTVFNKSTTALRMDIYSLDYGPRAGVIFKLIKSISLEGTYYYGINSIFPYKDIKVDWRIQQATVGIRFTP